MKGSQEYMESVTSIGQALADIQSTVVKDIKGNDRDLILGTIRRLKSDLSKGYQEASSEVVGSGTAQIIAGIF